MKKILIPTDFSKNSLNAVEYAATLAKKEKAKIILLNSYHYIPPAVDIPLPADVIQTLRSDSLKQLEALSHEIYKRKKIKCEYISQFNLAVPAILEVINEKKPELVIMGTKGASGVKEILIGSNTASVIEKAVCPIIAVPEKAKYNGIKKIMYASDYNESDVDALKKLAEIAKLFNASVIILHASDEEFNRFSEETYFESFKNKIKKKIRYNKISFKLVIGKLFERVLHNEISKNHIDLLAMSTKHRNLLEKLFGSSVTKKVVYHTEIPLIAFHHKKESVVFV